MRFFLLVLFKGYSLLSFSGKTLFPFGFALDVAPLSKISGHSFLCFEISLFLSLLSL